MMVLTIQSISMIRLLKGRGTDRLKDVVIQICEVREFILRYDFLIFTCYE